MLRAIIITTLFASPALAESTMFFGPNGSYEGNASTVGNSTIYYGSNGQYLGNAYTINNSTIYSGPNGSYEGSSYGPSVAAPYGE